jgi:pimeloyl-ACP methyl ester carboxylesterase
MLDQDELDADLQLLKKGMDAVIAAMEKALGSKMTPQLKATLAANDSEAIVAFFSAKHWRLSLEDALPAMTMPCLVFAGEADPLYPGARECVKSMPNATFISLPSFGHSGVMSQSHLLMSHITKFLTKVSQR